MPVKTLSTASDASISPIIPLIIPALTLQNKFWIFSKNNSSTSVIINTIIIASTVTIGYGISNLLLSVNITAAIIAPGLEMEGTASGKT